MSPDVAAAVAAIGAASLGAVAGAWAAPVLRRLAAEGRAGDGGAGGVTTDARPTHPPTDPTWPTRAGCAVVLAILTGAPLALQAHAGVPPAMWPGLLVAWWAAGAATLVDLASHRLPNVLVLRVGGAGVALLLVGTLVDGQLQRAFGVLAGAGIGYGVLALVAWLYPAGMGYGDVKLAALLGAVTMGPLLAGGMLVLAVLLGGAVALVGLATRRLRADTALPFGPFLLAGAIGAIAVHALNARQLAVAAVGG